MKPFTCRFFYFFIAVFLMISCAKDETSPEEEEPPVTNTGSFNWTLSSGQAITADSAHCYGSTTTIYAFKNGNSNSIEAALSSLAVGIYSISPATGNSFEYTSGSTIYSGVAGTLNISANAGNKLSGSFNVSLSGGSLSSISGSFTDIQKR